MNLAFVPTCLQLQVMKRVDSDVGTSHQYTNSIAIKPRGIINGLEVGLVTVYTENKL